MIRQFYDGYGEHFKLSDGSEFRYPPHKCSSKEKEEILCRNETHIKKSNGFSDILSGIKADDIVLIGVLLFLLYDGVDAYILLVILGIIFVMGLGEKEC